jgi:hypothetical protein
VCHGAANALARLTDLDLLQYESTVTTSSLDLSTWEEMAPVVAATLRDVNAFIDLVRTQLAAQPAARGNGLASLVEDAVLDDAARAELERVLESAASQLFEQVQTLGAKVRDPAVVADRWNLLAEVQASRTSSANTSAPWCSTWWSLRRRGALGGRPGARRGGGGAVAVRAAVSDLRRCSRRGRRSSARPAPRTCGGTLSTSSRRWGLRAHRSVPLASGAGQAPAHQYRHQVRSMAAVRAARADVVESASGCWSW